MRAQFVLCVLGAFVSTCAAEEAACVAGETQCVAGDEAVLLQGKIDVSGNAKDQDLTEKTDEEGWPDIFNKVKNALGGVDKLEKQFEGVKTSVKTFGDEVSSAVKDLTSNIQASMGIDAIRHKVKEFYKKLHDAAKKVLDALHKVSAAWLDGIGKVAPTNMKNAMNDVLSKVTEQGKHFANSFKHAADALHKVDEKKICAHVKNSLHGVLKKASDLAKAAASMSSKSLPKELLTAKDMLPGPLKKEVDRILEKADSAADKILSKITPAMKEITHGVAHAFDGHCTGLPHAGAGRPEVGAFLVLVLGALFFNM